MMFPTDILKMIESADETITNRALADFIFANVVLVLYFVLFGCIISITIYAFPILTTPYIAYFIALFLEHQGSTEILKALASSLEDSTTYFSLCFSILITCLIALAIWKIRRHHYAHVKETAIRNTLITTWILRASVIFEAYVARDPAQGKYGITGLQWIAMESFVLGFMIFFWRLVLINRDKANKFLSKSC